MKVTYSVELLEATINVQVERIEMLEKVVLEQSARINELRAALREAERFVSYLANETDGHFVGSGTPTTCLVMIRVALAPDQDK